MKNNINDSKRKYLIYASIILVILVFAYRLVLFNEIEHGGNGDSALINIIFFSAWLVPLYLGYKIAEKRTSLEYGIILSIVYIIADTLILDIDNLSQLNGSSIEREAMQTLLETGQVSFFPHLADIILLLVTFLILSYIGFKLGKK